MLYSSVPSFLKGEAGRIDEVRASYMHQSTSIILCTRTSKLSIGCRDPVDVWWVDDKSFVCHPYLRQLHPADGRFLPKDASSLHILRNDRNLVEAFPSA